MESGLFSLLCSSSLQSKQTWGLRYSGTLEKSNAIDRNKFARNLVSKHGMVYVEMIIFFLGKKENHRQTASITYNAK